MCDSALKKPPPPAPTPEGDGQFLTLARADNERQQPLFRQGKRAVYALSLTTRDESRKTVYSFRFSVFSKEQKFYLKTENCKLLLFVLFRVVSWFLHFSHE